MDLKEIKKTYPDVYQAIFDEGSKEGYSKGLVEGEAAAFEKGKTEGQELGIKMGADAERKRIQDVEAQLLPGHEALIAELKFDGTTTGEQAAVRVLQGETILRETVKAQLDADNPEAAAHAAAPEIEVTKTVDKNRPIEERAKAAWDNDASLRSEFLDDFDTYLAYLKADEAGQVKVIKGKE